MDTKFKVGEIVISNSTNSEYVVTSVPKSSYKGHVRYGAKKIEDFYSWTNTVIYFNEQSLTSTGNTITLLDVEDFDIGNYVSPRYHCNSLGNNLTPGQVFLVTDFLGVVRAKLRIEVLSLNGKKLIINSDAVDKANPGSFTKDKFRELNSVLIDYDVY